MESAKRQINILSIGTIILTVLIIVGGVFYYFYSNSVKLELKGSGNVRVGLYGVYKDEGAKGKEKGEDITNKIKVESNVNPKKAGEYEIKYTYNKKTITRKVSVSSKMNPELTFKNEKEISVPLGKKINLRNYTAKDSTGKNITKDVKINYSNLNKVGIHNIVYEVKDSKGNITRRERKVVVTKNTKYKTNGLPICMYHYVYKKGEEPSNYNSMTKGNFVEVKELEEQMKYLKDNNYYFPTWKEVESYAKGELILPKKSIVITFDDGSDSFLKVGVPILNKYKIPTTSFLIASRNGKNKVKKYSSDYISFQSHSYNMHRAGGKIGHGGIMTALSKEDIIKDVKKSTNICDNNEAFAYPFGDYNKKCEEALRESNIICALTTQYGKVFPGNNPLLLPRIRMTNGQSLNNFVNKIK